MKVNYVYLFFTMIFLAATSAGQHFVKITDPGNPIAADPGAPTNSYVGASWIDYDSDGLIDLFVNRNSTLYHNVGGGEF